MSTTEYSQRVLDHFYDPKNVGEIKDADGMATVGDPNCGDFIKVWIKVKDETVMDLKYKVFGCGAAIATTSMVSELAIGKTFEQAAKLTDNDVIVALGGLPSEKEHCSLLGIRGLQSAMANFLINDNHKRYQKRLDEYLAMGYDMFGSREKLAQRLDSLPGDARVLDVGTGKGHQAMAIAMSGRTCTSIDVSADEQHIARLNAYYFQIDDKINLQQQDITATDFQDESFDAVLSATALHHIKNTQPALEEILRITKKGGLIILADFNERGLAIVNRMHQKEGREHTCVGWDMSAIRSWLQKQNQTVDYEEEDCLWVLTIRDKRAF